MHACNDDTHPLAWEAASRREGPLAGLGRILRGLVEAAVRRHADRRGAAALMSMDEHLLRDIGVTRAEAYWIAREGRRH